MRYCIRVDDLPLCPGPTRQVGTQFRIESGYAPGSGKIEKLRPKWDDTFEINDSDPNALLEFGLDYCLVKKTVGGYDRTFSTIALLLLTFNLLMGIPNQATAAPLPVTRAT